MRTTRKFDIVVRFLIYKIAFPKNDKIWMENLVEWLVGRSVEYRFSCFALGAGVYFTIATRFANSLF